MGQVVSRVVFITGGSKGIGAACARRFIAEGDKVAVTYNSSPVPKELTDLGVLAVQCDVTSSASVDAAFTAVEAQLGNI